MRRSFCDVTDVLHWPRGKSLRTAEVDQAASAAVPRRALCGRKVTASRICPRSQFEHLSIIIGGTSLRIRRRAGYTPRGLDAVDGAGMTMLLDVPRLRTRKPPARYLLRAMDPDTGKALDRTYYTMKAALDRGAAHMRDGYYIEIWSPAFLESRFWTR